MAENILELQKFHPNIKIALWAHDGHVHKTDYVDNPDVKWMGQYLAEELKDQYKVIGFIVNEGEFTGYRLNQKNISERSNHARLFKAPADTVEAKFAELQVPAALVSLNNAELPAFLKEKPSARFTGCGEEQNDKEPWIKYDIAKGFDAVIFIKQATAAKVISRPSLKSLP